ncbi:MAG: response regulator [Ferruginibacter sp.]
MENLQLEILLVEDSKNDAELTIRAFNKKNLSNNILHLKDGASAINFLFGKGAFLNRDIGNKPKVILLDLKMPKVDGLEFLKKVKGNEFTKSIPVVVLSSSKENRDIEEAYSIGANSYVVKPVDFIGFTNAIVGIGTYWIQLNQPPLT